MQSDQMAKIIFQHLTIFMNPRAYKTCQSGSKVCQIVKNTIIAKGFKDFAKVVKIFQSGRTDPIHSYLHLFTKSFCQIHISWKFTLWNSSSYKIMTNWIDTQVMEMYYSKN